MPDAIKAVLSHLITLYGVPSDRILTISKPTQVTKEPIVVHENVEVICVLTSEPTD